MKFRPILAQVVFGRRNWTSVESLFLFTTGLMAPPCDFFLLNLTMLEMKGENMSQASKKSGNKSFQNEISRWRGIQSYTSVRDFNRILARSPLALLHSVGTSLLAHFTVNASITFMRSSFFGGFMFGLFSNCPS